MHICVCREHLSGCMSNLLVRPMCMANRFKYAELFTPTTNIALITLSRPVLPFDFLQKLYLFQIRK
jgi:hypothetical protein